MNIETGSSPGLFESIKESIRGSEQDFTAGSLNRAVGLLAVPMVLEMAGESVFAVCDAFFVARLGSEALASVGLTESMLELIYALAIGLSMATTALIARRVGEKNVRAASRAAVQAILVGIVTAAVFGALGAIYAPELLAMMGASPETVAEGTSYTRVMYAGMVTILLLFLNNAIFRGAGDAATAMRALWIANGINLVLDPCLIFGLGPFPELGLMGAAVATTMAWYRCRLPILAAIARGANAGAPDGCGLRLRGHPKLAPALCRRRRANADRDRELCRVDSHPRDLW